MRQFCVNVNFDAFWVIFAFPTQAHWIRHTLKPLYTNFHNLYTKTTSTSHFQEIFTVYTFGHSLTFQTAFLTYLRPPYWILWYQFHSNSFCLSRNEFPGLKNGIHDVSHKFIEWKLPNSEIHHFAGVAIFDDPQNDLNDLKKIEPYDFVLDGHLKVPNQP